MPHQDTHRSQTVLEHTKVLYTCKHNLWLARSHHTRHCYGISFREMAALTEALKELAADNRLKSKVVFCLGLEPFVEPDLQEDNQTC